MKRIAIIGSGISGLGAAFALEGKAELTVYEANDRPGGHAHTMDVDYDGTPISVDVGFIVYNAHNYPNLINFFKNLDVATKDSDMSFAVSNPKGFEWASTARGMFAYRRNLLRPRFHKFWMTILRFNDLARTELEADRIGDISLGNWLDKHDFKPDFLDNYILPMGGAIWSTPEAEMLNYPALSFFRFFENHRLMHRERPQWRTVSDGSRAYVQKMASGSVTGCFYRLKWLRWSRSGTASWSPQMMAKQPSMMMSFWQPIPTYPKNCFPKAMKTSAFCCHRSVIDRMKSICIVTRA